jgi:hypothetical protein
MEQKTRAKKPMKKAESQAGVLDFRPGFLRDKSCVQRTPDEQHGFISEIIKLSLFFAAEYQKNHPEEEISSVIMNRTALWEITGCKGTKEEASLTAELCALYKTATTGSEFEEAGYASLFSRMDIFSARNLEWEKRVLENYRNSCFRYDPPDKDRPSNHCNFHITNPISPKSILKETRYAAACFMRLMDESEKEFGFDTLRTSTWLNSVPQWLKYFPGEWIGNMGEPMMGIEGNLGFWGQAITARKTFSVKTGDFIRAHIAMPFKPRTSWCSFESLRKHLNEECL